MWQFSSIADTFYLFIYFEIFRQNTFPLFLEIDLNIFQQEIYKIIKINIILKKRLTRKTTIKVLILKRTFKNFIVKRNTDASHLTEPFSFAGISCSYNNVKIIQ